MKNKVTKNIGRGDRFTLVGAIDGKTYSHRVIDVTQMTYHDTGGQRTVTNITTMNDNGVKAVFGLPALMAADAVMV